MQGHSDFMILTYCLIYYKYYVLKASAISKNSLIVNVKSNNN